ncbi:TonB-dependent receptor, partial [Edaphobacter sp.]|uniref:TonB-dependent receptor n=1 Tax=Edaphobacter sp. TaxID=1934404 RepID=UPI002DB78F12
MRTLALLVFLLASAGLCRAQGVARINGEVLDTTGAAIPNAQAVLTDKATGSIRTVRTNGSGQYTFPALHPTNYQLSVTSPGFSGFTQDNILLEADQAATINVTLKVGEAGQLIEVTSAPPQIDVTTGTLAQVISERDISELPLNGRNAASLTTLVAGVTPAPSGASDQGNTKTFPVVVNVAVNGTRANQTNYLLDGGNNVDEYTNVNAPFPFPDALQEFSVQTSNFAAEYGQSAGGVVNIITRSGTAKYHGNAFEYVRNAALNAHNHFGFITNSSGQYVPYVDPLKRNQFGGTFGGPVGIPGLWKLKQGFFFLGYQHTALRTQTTSIATSNLPTTANESGLFNFNVTVPNTQSGGPTATQLKAGCVTNPYPTGTQGCYPYTLVSTTPGTSSTTYAYQSTIPTTSFDRAALALLKYIPTSSNAGTAFAYQKPTSQNLDEGVGRYDQDLGAKDHLVARYFVDIFHNQGVLNLANLLTYADGSDITYQNALVSDAHTFTSHLINNLIVSYQREGSVRGPMPGAIDVGDLGVNVYQPPTKAIQTLKVSGFFSIGDNPYGTFKRSNVTLADDVHWVKGNHSIAFGFHGELSRVDVINQNGQPGQFTFNATTTNSAIASFFLGYVNSFKQTSGQFQANRAKYTGAYAQDVWKAGRRVTFDFGLRYEPYIPIYEAGGRVGQFNPSALAA